MSSDNKLELSRRKILAGMGAVGAAGAGAGIGTSALFNDTESFEDNQLTAGSLDLKMDWEEHYSFPQIYDGFGDPTVEDGTELDVIREDPADDPDLNEDNYTGLPIPEMDAIGRDPVAWARNNDNPMEDGRSSLEVYFANTIIEAFPDDANTDPGGTFTFLESGDDGELLPQAETPCNLLSDVPNPGLSLYNEDPDDEGVDVQNPGRTFSDDTYDSENGEFEPLLNLDDIKPGDFGEFTFSTHLCDNPGYLWLQMPDGLTERENGVTEAEANSSNEDGTVDDPGSSPELAENIETTLWYDNNCNNRIDGEIDPLVFLAVLDTSGSQDDILGRLATAGNELADRLTNDADVDVYGGVITLENEGDGRDAILQSLDDEPPITEISNFQGAFETDPEPGQDNILPAPGNTGGSSPLPHALDVAREYLNDVVANDQQLLDPTDPSSIVSKSIPQNAQKEILLLSDGQPGYTDGRGSLISPAGDTIPDSNGDDIVSDHFDTNPNGETVYYPDPDTTDGGTSRAETVLVARDIDGNEFLAGSNGTYQGPGPKVDNPAQEGDPVDISGENDITIRGIVSYDSSLEDFDDPDEQQEAENTLHAIATGSNTYDLVNQTPESVVDSIVSHQNVTGNAEEVIFQGTLDQLATELDPSQDGPAALDFDRTTEDQDPYPAGTIHCFGLAWWVPTDVGNEIQSDSVSFDLGFVAEQARNNDNPGQTFGFGD